jgi:hypothetical protein
MKDMIREYLDRCGYTNFGDVAYDLPDIIFGVMCLSEKVQDMPYDRFCGVVEGRRPKTFDDLVAEPDFVIKVIAQFLEDTARKDDAERELFPSLSRFPKDESTWRGWVADAKKLRGRLKGIMMAWVE